MLFGMQPLYYLLYSGQFIPAARPQGVLACSLKTPGLEYCEVLKYWSDN